MMESQREKLKEILAEAVTRSDPAARAVYLDQVCAGDAVLRAKVALKIIKAGMDTREVLARFEAERQALALKDHPNIARVLDAGATGSGRPYFVMELVKGIKITDYCDQTRLSTEERLNLFVKVCHAIQHAHQKGIIHRDLKPSNVMVTLHDGEAMPKVIDFGIAKARKDNAAIEVVCCGMQEEFAAALFRMALCVFTVQKHLA